MRSCLHFHLHDAPLPAGLALPSDNIRSENGLTRADRPSTALSAVAGLESDAHRQQLLRASSPTQLDVVPTAHILRPHNSAPFCTFLDLYTKEDHASWAPSHRGRCE